nr:ABC transporter A family member 7-like [Ipomoea batatas]GMD07716.1 ABC transporter A family member 7-like [Ipomoea batatas]
MAEGPASFWTQANALLRKNLTFQKRNVRTNLWLISFPILICVLLVLLQTVVNNELDKPSRRCGCICIDTNGDGKCEKKCGIEYSTLTQAASCPLPSPPEWPPLLQIPRPEYRAVQNDFITYKDLPEESCKTTGSCPAAILLTGANQTFAEPYDFLNSNGNHFNVSIWYNSTYKNDTGNSPIGLTRVPRSVNMVSNAYLQFLLGPSTKMLFEFVKEMPKPETRIRLDFASLLGPLFFTWVVIQLFPVVLTSLVYEKQQKLRIIMKMHGLGDGPYWLISYAYFLGISSMYMLCFVIFGSLIGLKFFTLNDYSIQLVFYLIYINLQISLAFLVAALFNNVKTAAVVGYIMVFGSGLLGAYLFQFFVQDPSFSRGWIIVMELYPGFSLYRGLYEFSQYSFTGNYIGSDGMLWKNLKDGNNGMTEILIIMFVEWLLVLFFAYYTDQVMSSGKSPLFFLRNFQNRHSSSFRRPSLRRQGSKVYIEMEKPDVVYETILNDFHYCSALNGRGRAFMRSVRYLCGWKPAMYRKS